MAAGRYGVVRNLHNGMWGFQIELFLLAINYCSGFFEPQAIYLKGILGKNGLQI